MRMKYLLMSVVILVAVGMLITSGNAKIAPDTVVGLWTFDEDNDDTAKDLSKNENDGEIINAEWVDGKIGKAFQFDGGNSVIQIPHSDELSLEVFTVVAWIRLEVAGKWQYILCKTPPSPPPWQRNYSIQVATGDGFLGGFDDKAKVDAGQAPWTGVGSITKLADNEWHHVAVTYDKTALRSYIDGVMERQSDTTAEPVTNEEVIMIGTNVVNQGVNGAVDEVAVFNVALAEEDIKSILDFGLAEATGVMAVFPTGKLATTWGNTKTEY